MNVKVQKTATVTVISVCSTSSIILAPDGVFGVFWTYCSISAEERLWTSYYRSNIAAQK